MYLRWETHWLNFYTLSSTFHTLHTPKVIWPNLVIHFTFFCQKACMWHQDFLLMIFSQIFTHSFTIYATHFAYLLYISCNFDKYFTLFNKLGVYKHLLKLGPSMLILSYILIRSFTHSEIIIMDLSHTLDYVCKMTLTKCRTQPQTSELFGFRLK